MTRQIEGRNAVLEAIKAKTQIERIYVQDNVDDPKLDQIKQNNNVFFVTKHKLEAMSKTRRHQGVIAIAKDKPKLKLDEFIEMNPTGEHTQYAQYLLAMSFYIQIPDPGRDPVLSEKALKYFKIITTKFPNSVYAKDARLKINYIKNSLAQNELLIGMFYLKNNSPASSIKRFQAIIKNYQTTSVIPETLYRLCEAFLMLGLKEEAIKSSLLLSYNFPDNEWTNLSKNIIKDTSELNENEGFINSITDYIKKITN